MAPTRKPLEELAVDLLFESYGEHRYNRSTEDYERLSAMVPCLKQAVHRANQQLQKHHTEGAFRDRLICDFKVEDRFAWYRPYPEKIGIQTLRKGLASTGFRIAARRRRPVID
jgi:hypothetical protein